MSDKKREAVEALLGAITTAVDEGYHSSHVEAYARAYRALIGGEQPTSVKVEK